jgi:hypothetical protein
VSGCRQIDSYPADGRSGTLAYPPRDGPAQARARRAASSRDGSGQLGSRGDNNAVRCRGRRRRVEALLSACDGSMRQWRTLPKGLRRGPRLALMATRSLCRLAHGELQGRAGTSKARACAASRPAATTTGHSALRGRGRVAGGRPSSDVDGS